MTLRHDDLIVVLDEKNSNTLPQWSIARVVDINPVTRTVSVLDGFYNYPSESKTVTFDFIEKTPPHIVALTLSRYIQRAAGDNNTHIAVANVVKVLNTYTALWAGLRHD